MVYFDKATAGSKKAKKTSVAQQRQRHIMASVSESSWGAGKGNSNGSNLVKGSRTYSSSSSTQEGIDGAYLDLMGKDGGIIHAADMFEGENLVESSFSLAKMESNRRAGMLLLCHMPRSPRLYNMLLFVT